MKPVNFKNVNLPTVSEANIGSKVFKKLVLIYVKCLQKESEPFPSSEYSCPDLKFEQSLATLESNTYRL